MTSTAFFFLFKVLESGTLFGNLHKTTIEFAKIAHGDKQMSVTSLISVTPDTTLMELIKKLGASR